MGMKSSWVEPKVGHLSYINAHQAIPPARSAHFPQKMNFLEIPFGLQGI